MGIRVDILGKVAYIQGESRDNKAKAELYPSGEGVYAVMDGDNFVCLRVVSSKIHDDTITDKMSDTYKRKITIMGMLFPKCMMSLVSTTATERYERK